MKGGDKTQKCIRGSLGFCCAGMPPRKSCLAQALGSLTEAEGAALLPQVIPCRMRGGGPLAVNNFTSSACGWALSASTAGTAGPGTAGSTAGQREAEPPWAPVSLWQSHLAWLAGIQDICGTRGPSRPAGKLNAPGVREHNSLRSCQN